MTAQAVKTEHFIRPVFPKIMTQGEPIGAYQEHGTMNDCQHSPWLSHGKFVLPSKSKQTQPS
jgi:hypothetical protein